jgi:putative PIG3 family NAD(P)H quinone oxidoreductase
MQAIVLDSYGGPEVLRLRQIADPIIGPDDVLIAVKAAGVNRADILQREGRYPPPEPKLPEEVLGLECAGTVEAVGERVTQCKIGQRVAALVTEGAYAERVRVHERLTFPIADHLTWVEAAAIPEAFLTAYDALVDKAGVTAGDVVLVHAAAGGVGSAAVQLAHWMGATVLATVGSEDKAAWVRQLGADQTVLYRHTSFATVIAAMGRGVDVILDFVGQAYWEDNIASLAPGGTLVIIGTLSGANAAVDLGKLLQKRLTVRGTALRSRPLEARMQLIQNFKAHVLPQFASARLKPLVDVVFGFEHVAAAHQYLVEDRARGKVILAW